MSLLVTATGVMRAASAATLLGTSWTSSALYDVNTATGAATNQRTLVPGVADVVGISMSPSGQLYGLAHTNTSINSSALLTMSPATGARTLIGATGLPAEFEGDIDFSPLTGALYGLDAVPPGNSGPHQLFQLNTSTGVAGNFVNLSGASFQDLSGLAFSPTGTMYVLDTGGTVNSTLYTIDPLTGAVITTLGLNLDLGIVAGMDLDPATGTLYVTDGDALGGLGTDMLYSVNLATGTLTAIGPTRAGGLSSLAFVPEPTAASLLVLWALVGGRSRGRRRGPAGFRRSGFTAQSAA